MYLLVGLKSKKLLRVIETERQVPLRMAMRHQPGIMAQTTEVSQLDPEPGGGTLGIYGWGCATGRLEPLVYTRLNFATLC